MARIIEALESFFTNDDWRYTRVPDATILRMSFSGHNGNWQCYAQSREEQEQIVFYSVAPINAPENQRQPIAEFLTRANYGMILGNFELDFSDGEIRYKTSVDVEEVVITDNLIQPLVYANVAMMDKYLPGILAVIYGGKSPEDAVREIESPS